MEEIGNLFLLTREAAGVSLKEVSEDLDIEEAILENIEDGKVGSFSDIYILKEYVASYAKYLGLDPEKIIDEFNEFVFESTSKIPIKEIEKKMIENKKNEEEQIISPYTRKEKRVKNSTYLILYIILISLFIIACMWSIKQITINSKIASNVNYKG